MSESNKIGIDDQINKLSKEEALGYLSEQEEKAIDHLQESFLLLVK